MSQPQSGYRICTSCDNHLPTNQFELRRLPNHASTLMTVCKTCVQARHRTRVLLLHVAALNYAGLPYSPNHHISMSPLLPPGFKLPPLS